MSWRPSAGGLSATVTIIAVDGARALVHVRRASTGTCAPHWVDLGSLSGAPQEARPCPCAGTTAAGHDAA